MFQEKFGKTACKGLYIVLRYVIICWIMSLLVFVFHLGFDEMQISLLLVTLFH